MGGSGGSYSTWILYYRGAAWSIQLQSRRGQASGAKRNLRQDNSRGTMQPAPRPKLRPPTSETQSHTRTLTLDYRSGNLVLSIYLQS